ncbi:MAG: hypothetical protein KAR47_04560 [Planctomycetes bacterium]|nr:hypothetical protein [Planctomycetota bacterium]
MSKKIAGDKSKKIGDFHNISTERKLSALEIVLIICENTVVATFGFFWWSRHGYFYQNGTVS